jgi:hypothetical protein
MDVVLELLGVPLSPTKAGQTRKVVLIQRIQERIARREVRLVTAATVEPVTRPVTS